MRISFVAVSLSLSLMTLAAIAAGQNPPQPPADHLKNLDWLVGQWVGEGEMNFGPGNVHSVRVEELVQKKLGGTVLLIEGVGREGKPGTPDERIVHQALGVVFFDRATGKHYMDAFLANGNNARCELEIRDRSFVWGFDQPQAGRIRYTATLDADGQWHEIGERSPDGGVTWHQFFTMTLKRENDAGSGEARR